MAWRQALAIMTGGSKKSGSNHQRHGEEIEEISKAPEE